MGKWMSTGGCWKKLEPMLNWPPGYWILLVLGVLALLVVGVPTALMARGRYRTNPAADDLLRLAASRAYAQMSSEGLASKNAIDTFRLLDEKHGPIQSYRRFKTFVDVLGTPSAADFYVTRGDKEYVDEIVYLGDPGAAGPIVEYPKEDYFAHRADRGLSAPF